MNKKIGDLIETPEVRTVIRLEEDRLREKEITTSFVFTAEVDNHVTLITEALSKETGRGFFLQGDFGSGKSHFLAVLSAWLEHPDRCNSLSGEHDGIREFMEHGRRYLPVPLSLVKYRSSTPLERIVLEGIESEMSRRGYPAVLSPVSAFFERFKELLSDASLNTAFQTFLEGKVTETEAWFREKRSEAYTTCVRFLHEQKAILPEALIEERHVVFERAIKEIREAGYSGMVLLLDELSEFFGSKPEQTRLNDDARTLQFLGELAATQPLWIIAAVQESIERTSDIAHATLRKIKDRFPVKLSLTTLHIRDLISRRLVRHKSGADKVIEQLHREYASHFSTFSTSFDLFRSVYPIHPVTLALLEGLSELFSQHRGIVDFVHYRIAGDPGRNIPGILGRPAEQMLTPDSIYEHFTQRINEFSAFHVYPRHIVPHLDEVIEQTLSQEDDRVLGRKLVRILVLYTLHPTAQAPTAAKLAELSACMLSGYDKDANVEFITGAILDPIAEKSPYLSRRLADSGKPVDTIYLITTQEDHDTVLRNRITNATQKIPSHDSRLVSQPLSELPASASWPGPELWHSRLERSITWRNSRRTAVLFFVHAGEEEQIAATISDMIQMGKADFGFGLELGTKRFFCPHTVVWQIEKGEAGEDLLKEYLGARLVADRLRPSNPADAPLIPLLRDHVARLEPAVQNRLLELIYAGSFNDTAVTVEPAARTLRLFDRFLEFAAQSVLEKRYPRFKEIAPRLTLPTQRTYQRLFDEFIVPGSLSVNQARNTGLTEAIENVAGPLGLVELKTGSFRLSPNPGVHPFLNEVFGLFSSAGTTPLNDVFLKLKTGLFGVPEDTVSFLLASLAQSGLVSLIQNNRPISLDFLRLTSPQLAHSVTPGELINQAARETLMTLCPFLSRTGSFETFGLRQQRDAWQAAITLKKSVMTVVTDVRQRLDFIEELDAFRFFDIDSMRSLCSRLYKVFDEIKTSYTAREGLERFLDAWRRYAIRSEDIERVKQLSRFFKQDAEQYIFISHYINHQSVVFAASADDNLRQGRDAVTELMRRPADVTTDEGWETLNRLFSEFRTGYAVFYQQCHAAYYRSLERPRLSRREERLYALLRSLSGIEQLDRPVGLNTLLKRFGESPKSRCTRNLTEELMRHPECGCGITAQQQPEAAPLENPAQALESGLVAYTGILTQPRVIEALTARAYAVKDIKPDVANRLSSLAALVKGGPQRCASQLPDVLDAVTVEELATALSGTARVESRRLDALTTKLSGRRLTREKISGIVGEWLNLSDEKTIVSIDTTDRESSDADGNASVNWWTVLHPELQESVRPDGGITEGNARNLEQTLERVYPADTLRREVFIHAQNKVLGDFITGEWFHTAAVRAAWQLLARRVMEGSVGHGELPPAGSRHAIPEVRDAIRRRTAYLHNALQTTALGLPGRLQSRLAVSAVAADPWATKEMREACFHRIGELESSAEDWFRTIPPVPSVSWEQRPLLIVVDGIPPDVWLAVDVKNLSTVHKPEIHWFRLEQEARTLPALTVLAGFDDGRDPAEEFHARGITYRNIDGTDIASIVDSCEELRDGSAMVIRITSLDKDAHAGLVHLHDMPGKLLTILEHNLEPLVQLCKKQKRPCILTTDHGCTLHKRGLEHGSGGVFEQTVIHAVWLP